MTRFPDSSFERHMRGVQSKRSGELAAKVCERRALLNKIQGHRQAVSYHQSMLREAQQELKRLPSEPPAPEPDSE